MAAESECPEPVEGLEFLPSTTKAINFLAGGFLLTGMALLVVGMRAGWWDLFGGVPTLWFTIIAIIVGMFGPALIVVGSLMLVRKRRAVIGRDRFQFVEIRAGRETAVAQFLYSNVDGLRFLNNEEGIKSVKVHLKDRDAAGTYDMVLAIQHGDLDGTFDFEIEDRFQGRIEELSEALKRAIEAWRQ